MGRVVIVGAGGVAWVAAHKCAQNPDVFSKIFLVSRSLDKCVKIQQSVLAKTGRVVEVERVDVNTPNFLSGLQWVRPDVVINLASPWLDLTIMDACLKAGVNYVDTANWEPLDGSSVSPKTGSLFRYQEQWDRSKAFKEAGLMAVIGAGYDPGVTQNLVRYAADHHFNEIHTLDILDCNAGDHGLPFATNFDPEANIREVNAPGKYWDGDWRKIPPIVDEWGSRKDYHRSFEFPETSMRGGPVTKEGYVLYHEELESLVEHFPEIRRARFWMTFGEQYLTHLRVLNNVGMTGINPIIVNDVEVIPLQVLKKLLPDPASLGRNYRGKTHIGCYMTGLGKDGKSRRVYIYNVKDFQNCYRETEAQAISYTAGAPPVLAAELMIRGLCKGEGVFNVEELNPDRFITGLDRYGLPQSILVDDQVPDFGLDD
jgi:saccharopine dehydrogenase (NAD+, L-lysine-forming)